MILYNITILVSWPVNEQWVIWIKQEYIPKLMSTGLFTRYQLVKLIEVNEEEGATYALQLYAAHKEDFIVFREQHLHKFQQMERDKWGDNSCSFSSLMEVIN